MSHDERRRWSQGLRPRLREFTRKVLELRLKEAVMKKVCNHCVSSDAHKKDGKFLVWTEAKKHVENFLRKYPGAIAEHTETYEERGQFRADVLAAEHQDEEAAAAKLAAEQQDVPDDDAAV